VKSYKNSFHYNLTKLECEVWRRLSKKLLTVPIEQISKDSGLKVSRLKNILTETSFDKWKLIDVFNICQYLEIKINVKIICIV
jgi:hypothetical protein